MWDPHIGMGTVTHQNIGYLFPMGPYYWVLDKLGVPDWVAQRLWLGSILFFAALGVLYLLRTFGLRGPGVVVAAIAYMFTPYTLDYSARISVMLLPFAALAVADRPDAQGAARRRLALSRDLRARRAGHRRRQRDRADLRGCRPGAVDRRTRGSSSTRSTGAARSASRSASVR